MLAYLKYFFYIGLHWNWSIAFSIILQEIKGEKKYNINTTGANELKELAREGTDISHATIYMPVSYLLLEQIFTQLATSPKKHLLDIGSGKGRVLCVAAFNGYETLTGIDFSKKLCIDAEKNLLVIKSKFSDLKATILNENAVNYNIPPNVDCIFLFNPFDEKIMTVVVKNIIKSLQKNPRQLNVVYINPLYKHLFVTEGFREWYYSKKRAYFEVSILNIPVL